MWNKNGSRVLMLQDTAEEQPAGYNVMVFMYVCVWNTLARDLQAYYSILSAAVKIRNCTRVFCALLLLFIWFIMYFCQRKWHEVNGGILKGGFWHALSRQHWSWCILTGSCTVQEGACFPQPLAAPCAGFGYWKAGAGPLISALLEQIVRMR